MPDVDSEIYFMALEFISIRTKISSKVNCDLTKRRG